MSELAEIKALVQQQMAASEARHTENVRDREALRSTIGTVVSQVQELDRRLQRSEKLAEQASGAAHRALNAQTDLEGALMAEVGALASNDQKQNEALKAIRAETFAQSSTLDTLVKSETRRSAREDVIYWAITKGVPLLWAATVALGGAWLATHR